MDIVFLFYGLSFLLLGIVIVVRCEHESQLELSRFVWLLAAFAFSHGLLEWTDLWRIVRGDAYWLPLIHAALLFISYLFLFEFGRRLVRASLTPAALGKPASQLLGSWVYIPLLFAILSATAISDRPEATINSLSRYLAGTSGSFLAGAGFYLYYHARISPYVKAFEPRILWLASYVASTAFIAYGVFGGLVVPKQDWFPASVINEENFLTTFQMSVQVLRTACAVLIGISTTLLLKVFYVEGLKRLQEKDVRYRTLFDTAIVGIVLFDRTGILDCNSRSEAMFGCTRRGLLGRTLADLSPERQPNGQQSSAAFDEKIQAASTGKNQIFEWEFLAEGDGSIDTEITLNQVDVDDADYLQAIIRDITERKQAAKTTKQYHTVIQASMDGFWITDHTGRILDVNDSICRISGYSREELLHLSIADIEADETLEDTAVHIREMIEKGYVQFEARHKRKDGTIINVDVSILHVPELYGRFFCFMRDITRRKWEEAELLAAKEEAEHSSRAKSEFIQAMNHELRTPLAVVLGQAELLKAEVANESQKKQIDIIQTAGWDLLRMINQVLDLSSIEAGDEDLEMRPVETETLLQECLHLYQPLAAERGMDVQCEPHATVRVAADSLKLKQAVLNYLSNAVKYGRENGTIRITVAEQNGWVRISVVDDGEGISLDRQKDLFTSFNRLGLEGSCIRGGGLGLSLTKELVEQMGGRVGAESLPGHGSVFWLELAAAKVGAEAGKG